MHKQQPQTAYRKDAVLTGTVFEDCDKYKQPKAPIRYLPDGGLWLFILEKEEDRLIILRCGSS